MKRERGGSDYIWVGDILYVHGMAWRYKREDRWGREGKGERER